MNKAYLPVLAAGLFLAGCEVKVGDDAAQVSSNASAAGKAEDGRLTIEAPGFNMSMKIPESDRANTRINDDKLIYPGSNFGGIHVQGKPGRANGEGDGEVEIRFTTNDTADRVLAWYGDPARGGGDFVMAPVQRQGNAYFVSGMAKDGDGRLALRLVPLSGGGTEGRLLISDR